MTSLSRSFTEINSVDEAMSEYWEKGNIIFDAKTKFDTIFKIKVLLNGIITGEIEFEASPLFSNFLSRQFILIGKIDRNNLTLIASGCFFAKVNHSLSKGIVTATIHSRKLFVSPEGNLVTPKREVYLSAGAVNVSETFRVIVESAMGQLQIAHQPDVFQKFENLIRNFKTPIITSVLELITKPSGTKMRVIIEQFTNTYYFHQ